MDPQAATHTVYKLRMAKFFVAIFIVAVILTGANCYPLPTTISQQNLEIVSEMLSALEKLVSAKKFSRGRHAEVNSVRSSSHTHSTLPGAGVTSPLNFHGNGLFVPPFPRSGRDGNFLDPILSELIANTQTGPGAESRLGRKIDPYDAVPGRVRLQGHIRSHIIAPTTGMQSVQSFKDSVKNVYFSGCLAPYYSSFADQFKLKGKFGERDPLLDQLLNLLSTFVFEANTGGFDTSTIETILSLFLSSLKLSYRDGSLEKTEMAVKQESIVARIFKSIAGHLRSFPDQDFLQNLLILATRVYSDAPLNSDERIAFHEVTEYFRDYYLNLINSTHWGEETKSLLTAGIKDFTPLILQRILSNGEELDTAGKKTVLKHVLRLFIANFATGNEEFQDNTLLDFVDQIFAEGRSKEEVNDELQQLFQYLLDTAFARIPEEQLSEKLNELQLEGCLETLKELARGISENIVELINDEG